MKNLIACCIIMAICFSFPNISSATVKKSEDTKNKVQIYEISLDTIDEIVFKSSKYLKESQERKQRLINDLSKYERQIRKLKKEDSEDDWGNASTISSLYDQLRTSRYNLQVADIAENAGLKKQALMAKIEYLKYMSMKLEQKILEEKEQQQKQLNILSQKKYEKGLLSLVQYEEILNRSISCRDEIFEEEKKVQNQEQSFKSAVGLKEEDNIHFNDVKDFNYSQFEQISFVKDMEETLKNSQEIHMQEMKVEHLENEFVKDRRVISDNKKELEELKENLKRSFKNQYNQLDSMAKKIEKSNRDLGESQKTLNISKQKYQRGLLSKKDFKEANLKHNEIVNQKKNVDLQMQEVFLTYQLLKEGYQSTFNGTANIVSEGE